MRIAGIEAHDNLVGAIGLVIQTFRVAIRDLVITDSAESSKISWQYKLELLGTYVVATANPISKMRE